MPGAKPTSLLDKAARKIAPKAGAKAAYPIAVASLQKAGDLRAGSLKPTAKGKARNAMTPQQRMASRISAAAAKGSK